MSTGVGSIGLLVVILVVVIFATFSFVIRRYRRCPSDKILVVYGRKGKGSARCVHGGGAFVLPVLEDYAYLSLIPISIDANLTNALSRQNIRVDVPCRFTVGISSLSIYTDVDNFSLGALTQGITLAIPVVVSLLAFNTEELSIVISSCIS